MNFTRDEFFACAGFAAHENRRIRLGNFLDHRAHALHSFRCADQSAARCAFDFNATTKRAILAAQLHGLESVFDGETQVVQLERFGEIVVRAGLDSFDGHALRAVRCDENDERSIIVCLLQFA